MNVNVRNPKRSMKPTFLRRDAMLERITILIRLEGVHKTEKSAYKRKNVTIIQATKKMPSAASSSLELG